MNRYSWFTENEKDSGGWYKCNACVEFPQQKVSFDAYPYYKPNRKGGYNRKESHLLNVEGKKYFGNRWARCKKLYDPKGPLFQGVPKRNWLKVEITKIHLSMMTFAGILSLSSDILGIKAEEKEDGRK